MKNNWDWTDLPATFNISTAALVTGYGKQRIRELCHAKKIPHVRLGRAFMFSRDALKMWFEHQATSNVEGTGLMAWKNSTQFTA